MSLQQVAQVRPDSFPLAEGHNFLRGALDLPARLPEVPSQGSVLGGYCSCIGCHGSTPSKSNVRCAVGADECIVGQPKGGLLVLYLWMRLGEKLCRGGTRLW